MRRCRGRGSRGLVLRTFECQPGLVALVRARVSTRRSRREALGVGGEVGPALGWRGRCVEDVGSRRPCARAVATASSMLSSPAMECASVETTSGTPASTARRACSPGEIEPVGEAVDLERHAGFERDLDHPLEVERVRRPEVDDPAFRMAQATDRRMAHRLGYPCGYLGSLRPLARMKTELHPVELVEHVVREVEASISAYVAFDSAEMCIGATCSLPARSRRPGVGVVGRETADRTDARGVVADGDVGIAAAMSGLRHLAHGGASIRPGRVHVEVAPNVTQLDKSRRLAAERRLP